MNDNTAMISGRLPADLVDRLRQKSLKENRSQTSILEECLRCYFDGEPAAVTSSPHSIDLMQCKREYAMILELCDKCSCTKETAFISLMDYVIAGCGEPEQEYINKVNAL